MSNEGSDRTDALAELADLLLNVGRLLRARTPRDVDLVPLTETERTVMRIVDLFPTASPSEIADRAMLQRTNVSTALRTLEDKGLVDRTTDGGRGVTVTGTPLAAENLAALRSAWAEQLHEVLGPEMTGVEETLALLSRLEIGLVTSR